MKALTAHFGENLNCEDRTVSPQQLWRGNARMIRRKSAAENARLNLQLAGRAERASAQIDPLDGVGRGHGAAVILAVAELQSVAQFVNGFFEHALAQQRGVGSKAVKFLPQTVKRDKSASAAELSLAENVFQNRDVEIGSG